MAKTWEWEQKISEEIFKQKYMLHGEKDIEEVFSGIATEISSAEKGKKLQKEWEEKFYKSMIEGKFIPAGRILANARINSKLKNYNNCFTIEIKDDLNEIFTSLKEDAIISKMGGGVGFDLSPLRPKNSELSCGGFSSGAISFLEIFNSSAKVIHSAGLRRSAHIALMDISHPDIEEFITCKRGAENNKLTQFNLSVKITNKFIKAVNNDLEWDLVFAKKVYKTLKAKDLFDVMIKHSFYYNEPGYFNVDTINKYNNAHWLYDIQQCNACGEQMLPVYGACDLGSLNLTKFITYDENKKSNFDWISFRSCIEIGVRFLDNVLDKTNFPLDKIKKRTLDERRIGLGLTGLGDTLAMLDIIYGDNQKCTDFIKLWGKNLRETSYKTSIELAKEKGYFPLINIEELLKSKFIKKLPSNLKEGIKRYGLRNLALNTIAPVGTGSMTVGNNCSSGIEPIFSLEYNRIIKTDEKEEKKEEKIFDYAYLKYLQNCKNEEEKKEIPVSFVTTEKIKPEDHIIIQSIAQEYIDSSISKTINLPLNYSFEEYKKLFMLAYEKELKGFTTFNPSGNLKGVLQYQGVIKRPEYIERIHAPVRPKNIPCDIHEMRVNGQRYIALCGILNGTVYEIFVTDDPKNKIDHIKFKKGYLEKIYKGQYSLIIEDKQNNEKTVIDNIGEVFNSTYASLSRLISMSLRHGTPLEFLCSQLSKDDNFMGFEKTVMRVLKKYIRDGEKVLSSLKCKSCKSVNLIFQSGCVTCRECGWGECG